MMIGAAAMSVARARTVEPDQTEGRESAAPIVEMAIGAKAIGEPEKP